MLLFLLSHVATIKVGFQLQMKVLSDYIGAGAVDALTRIAREEGLFGWWRVSGEELDQ